MNITAKRVKFISKCDITRVLHRLVFYEFDTLIFTHLYPKRNTKDRFSRDTPEISQQAFRGKLRHHILPKCDQPLERE